MNSKFYPKYIFIPVVFILMTGEIFAQLSSSPSPSITGPVSVCEGASGVAYTVPENGTWTWSIADALGTPENVIASGQGTASVTVDWTAPGEWILSVTDGIAAPLTLTVTVHPASPSITGPLDIHSQMPATLIKGNTTGQVYSTDTGMSGYAWSVSPFGIIQAGQGTESVTVDWLNVSSQQTISVSYTDPNGCATSTPSVLVINYFPFAGPIDPTTIPQFVDPLPHFAAGLRVNAKTGGSLKVRTQLVQQVALSTGTVLSNGIIGDPLTPNAGKGNYAAYQISKDNGASWGPAMWPAQTVEAQQGFPLTVQYENGLSGLTYDNFNILADQTLMMKGYALNGDPLTEPYLGEIPMVVHLHGGEIPSASDGGPNSWFMPSGQLGPAFQYNASSLMTYPNHQEATTAWFHPHDDGLTRINVYTGLAGFYFIRGADEEQVMLPGWSGDDLVREVAPANTSGTFNGPNAYLPEIEIAIQDRMFDVNGQLYWPVAPPNPEIHPFWTPEFIGDIMTVNGKAWPYLSVAPRKYRFRFLDGCNARWLNMWLENLADNSKGPVITVVGIEGGLLATPVPLDPALGKTMTIGPGQRFDVVIDFTGILAGTTFTLMNDAGAPYPDGDPVIVGLTDRIMQFVVNGELVSSADPALPGTDKSALPANLRPVTPLVQLTDFAGNLAPGVVPAKKRQLLLNEVMGLGGPASVLVNNTYFDTELSFSEDPNYRAGGPTEFMTEGTTEIIQIANVSADAHPMHIHLTQWQLVSRQAMDAERYLSDYMTAWAPKGLGEFPAGMGYPGGAGTPFSYDAENADAAIGGNPAFGSYLVGPVIPANPEEMGWKDNVTVYPGQVTTFAVRIAPTDKPVNAPPEQLLYPFDPSLGPGYVWHCHVIDHEDMSMMRPLMILPSPERLPKFSAQPVSANACTGDAVVFSVAATSPTALSYQWEFLPVDGMWTKLADGAPYSGTLTASLSISPAVTGLSGNQYRCILTNNSGNITSAAGTLTVNDCSVSGTLKYNNLALEPLAGFTVSINGLPAITDNNGAFNIPGMTSGAHPVIITAPLLPGSINSTDAGAVNGWSVAPIAITAVKYLAGDVDNNVVLNATDGQAILNYFVSARPFIRAPWSFHNAAAVPAIINPTAFTVNVNGTSVENFNILGMSTGDFNGSFSPNLTGQGTSKIQLIRNPVPMPVAYGAKFDLPVITTSPLQVGSVSLVLNINSTLVKVQNVKIPGSTGPVRYNVVGNELRIGWTSTTPLIVAAGAPLVVLSLDPTPAFTNAQTQKLSLGLVPTELNELADGFFNTILTEPTLTVDDVIVTSAKVNSLQLTAFPNPATSNTTIVYEIPVAGTVTLGLYTTAGVPAISPLFVDGLTVSPGVYTINTDVGLLVAGTYYVKMTFNDGKKTSTKSIRFVKQ